MPSATLDNMGVVHGGGWARVVFGPQTGKRSNQREKHKREGRLLVVRSFGWLQVPVRNPIYQWCCQLGQFPCPCYPKGDTRVLFVSQLER